MSREVWPTEYISSKNILFLKVSVESLKFSLHIFESDIGALKGGERHPEMFNRKSCYMQVIKERVMDCSLAEKSKEVSQR